MASNPPLIEIQGPDDLKAHFDKIKDPKKSFLFFSKPSLEEQRILYINKDQRFLIVTDGKQHYCYDITGAKAASNDVVAALGKGLRDVSGEEARKNLADSNYDVAEARSKSLAQLPKDKELALQYGYAKIAEARREAPVHNNVPRL